MRLRTIRSFAPGLLGLFLLGQVAGVLPLIYAHTVSVFGAAHVNAYVRGHAGGSEHGSGDRLADADDMCCALHHGTTAILPAVIDFVPIGAPKSPLFVGAAKALAEGKPARLDRPPKPLT